MKPLLENYIRTLASGNQRRVSEVLREATVSKQDVQTVINTLSSLQALPDVKIAKINPLSVITADEMKMNLRDVQTHFADMFRMSNLLSVFLQSQSAVLSSEIKALSDEINNLEKLVENYSFLLSENSAYNYAYLETFSDDKNRDNFDFRLTDRAGGFFTDQEQAYVNSASGNLILAPSIIDPYPLVGQIIKSNIGSNIVTQTPLRNAFNRVESEGWLLNISTPTPIATSMPEAAGVVGAQIILEATLPQVSSCNQIDISPIAEQDIDIVRVIVFAGDNDFQGVDVLTTPIAINAATSLTFPIQSVKKIQILINQRKYTRPALGADLGELLHSNLWGELCSRQPQDEAMGVDSNIMRSNIRGHKHLSIFDYVISHNREHMSWSIPTADAPAAMNQIESLIRLRRNKLAGLNEDILLSSQTRLLSSVVHMTASQSLYSHLQGLTTKVIENNNQELEVGKDPLLSNLVSLRLQAPKFIRKPTSYKYLLGLKNVSIGLNVLRKKGVHISKPLQSNGDMGQVRLRVSEKHFRSDRSDIDSSRVSSVEYSVSNIAEPREESDWTPILPVDQVFVEAERLLVDSLGRGYLRFPAAIDESITLYKNNIRVNPDELIYAPNQQTVIGLKVRFSSNSKNDVYTVDYFPAGDPTLVRFSDFNFDLPPLMAAHTSSGPGEWFERTSGRNSVALSHYPYIDYNQVLDSTYVPLFGLADYQPITVSIAAKVAVNLTNYTKNLPGNESSKEVPLLPDAADGYYYYHSNNVLIFNQPITVPFSVSYQYLENTVRVRTVLRVNGDSDVSPQVGYWQIKAKTRRPDLGAEV